MDQPPDIPPPSVWVTFWLGSWACFAAWFTAAWRLWHGRSVIPFQRRRQVPWGGIDVLLVFAFFISASVVMLFAIELLLGPRADAAPAGADVETSHAVVQLFRGGNIWAISLCVFSAVLVAPIVEEFLFRVLLQGWLEKLDRRLRPMMPFLRRTLPWSVVPILLSSTLFAIVHFRVAAPPVASEYLIYMTLGNSLVGIVTAVVAVVLLRFRTGATAADMGLVVKKIPSDAWLGLLAAAGVILPIFIMQGILNNLLPDWVAADPLPLFCLAVVLGTLYCRTHRVVASIVLHMSLNATSLVILWLFMSAN